MEKAPLLKDIRLWLCENDVSKEVKKEVSKEVSKYTAEMMLDYVMPKEIKPFGLRSDAVPSMSLVGKSMSFRTYLWECHMDFDFPTSLLYPGGM